MSYFLGQVFLALDSKFCIQETQVITKIRERGMFYDEIDKKIRKLIWTQEIFLESFSVSIYRKLN